MSIHTIITRAREIETLNQEIFTAKQSNNLIEANVKEMQIDILTTALKKDIESYISSKAFNKEDRYRILLEKENISLMQPTISELLDAFEDYEISLNSYRKEREWLSRDLVNILLENMNRAKDEFIKVVSAFLRAGDYYHQQQAC